jgi:hypothetical protein
VNPNENEPEDEQMPQAPQVGGDDSLPEPPTSMPQAPDGDGAEQEPEEEEGEVAPENPEEDLPLEPGDKEDDGGRW